MISLLCRAHLDAERGRSFQQSGFSRMSHRGRKTRSRVEMQIVVGSWSKAGDVDVDPEKAAIAGGAPGRNRRPLSEARGRVVGGHLGVASVSLGRSASTRGLSGTYGYVSLIGSSFLSTRQS